MAATDCALRAVLRPGDHVVIPDDAYGGTFRLIDKVFTQWGIELHPGGADRSRRGARRDDAERPSWSGSRRPTNPLLSIADIAGIAALARGAGAKVLVDNTFASPALQQPLPLGADVVLHSTTKYIGGHSDVVGGALLTNDEELDDRVRVPAERRGRGAGAVRRVPDHARAQDAARCGCSGTARTPRWSPSSSPGIRPSSTVLYPGLPQHPNHAVAAQQMSAFGGMVSVRLRGGRRGRARLLLAHRDLHPRRVAGRRRVADRAPRRDDARVDRGFAAGGARTIWCGCRSASRTSPTCWAIWSRRYASSAERTADAVTARFISGSRRLGE